MVFRVLFTNTPLWESRVHVFWYYNTGKEHCLHPSPPNYLLDTKIRFPESANLPPRHQNPVPRVRQPTFPTPKFGSPSPPTCLPDTRIRFPESASLPPRPQISVPRVHQTTSPTPNSSSPSPTTCLLECKSRLSYGPPGSRFITRSLFVNRYSTLVLSYVEGFDISPVLRGDDPLITTKSTMTIKTGFGFPLSLEERPALSDVEVARGEVPHSEF